MSRHPYTHAADWLRELVGTGAYGQSSGGLLLSRADASNIRQAFCAELGLDDEEVANTLSLRFMKEHGIEQ